MHYTPAQFVAFAAAFSIAALRLLTSTQPLWTSSRFAKYGTVIAPALIAALAAVPTALESATSWPDIGIALIGVLSIGFAAAHGKKPPSPPGDSTPVGAVPLSVRPPGGFDAELRAWPGVALACLLALACNPRNPPCDETKLRAVDKAFLKRVAAECLEYPSAAACPAYPALKADHRAELRKVCPQ